MVDGVHGSLNHVVRHVVVEYRTILECVTTLSLHVEEKTAKVQQVMQLKRSAMIFAVQVSLYCSNMYEDRPHFTLAPSLGIKWYT